MQDPGSLTPQEYRWVHHLVYRQSGIELGPAKQTLVEARLGKRLRQLGIASYAAYFDLIDGDATGEELSHLLDLISTNVTAFFRERPALEFVAQRHRASVASGQRRFRYWSAASSSGQEAFSLAMLLEPATGPGTDVAILGTDISTRMVAAARRGRYPHDQLPSIPQEFRRLLAIQDGTFEMSAGLRSRCVFNHLNLVKPPFPMRGPFDAILCRNVMIYFDTSTRIRLVQEMRRLLAPGGILVTGQAESLSGCVQGFRVLRPSIYERE